MSVTTLEIPAARSLTDLLSGDRIVAIDGTALDEARTVEQPRVATGYATPEATRIVNTLDTETDWFLYPGNFETVTVERGAPDPTPVPAAESQGTREAREFIASLPKPTPPARETGTIRPVRPRTPALQGRAHWRGAAVGSNPSDPDDVKRARKVLRNPSYQRALRELADRPNGFWQFGPNLDDAFRRSWGTTFGFMSRYGWCTRIDTAPAAWQITQTGLDLIIAFDAEHPETNAEREERAANARGRIYRPH